MDNVVADTLSLCPDFTRLAVLFSVTPGPFLDLCDLGVAAEPVSDTFADLLSALKEDQLCKKLIQDLQSGCAPENDPLRGLMQVATLPKSD